MKRLFVETKIFTERLEEKKARALLEAIQAKILENPMLGDLIPGCGGVRKFRISDPTRQKGTRGGLRILFLDLPHKSVAYLIYLYGKDEAEDISPEIKNRIREIATILKGENS